MTTALQNAPSKPATSEPRSGAALCSTVWLGRILVACEYSGAVRDAFAARGWDSWSCDLIPSEKPGKHYQGDVRDVLDQGWDILVAHPPCTYLCNAGMNWLNRKPGRRERIEDAKAFFLMLANAPIRRIAIENPVGIMSRLWRKPDQVIQPWMFGDEANKPTCLWLKNLPPLMHSQETDLLFQKTHVGRGRFYVKANGDRLSVWSHKASGTIEQRARIASRTFPGVAEAMANQWTLAMRPNSSYAQSTPPYPPVPPEKSTPGSSDPKATP